VRRGEAGGEDWCGQALGGVGIGRTLWGDSYTVPEVPTKEGLWPTGAAG
jgi:hypothetical protein